MKNCTCSKSWINLWMLKFLNCWVWILLLYCVHFQYMCNSTITWRHCVLWQRWWKIMWGNTIEIAWRRWINHGDQLKVVVTCNQSLLNRIKFQLILHDDHGLQFWDLVEGYDLLRRIMSKNDKWETIVTNV
jgi:hypothetical protein